MFTDTTIALFTLLPITRLNIPYHDFLLDTLIDLLHYLPNLHSLTLWSLSLQKTSSVCDKQAMPVSQYLLCKPNKITRVNIQSLTELSQLQSLLDLCPNIQYLQIGCLDDIDPKPFIKFLLTKNSTYISQLRILYLYIPTANAEIIQECQEMFDSGSMCCNYTVAHLYNKIAFQWK